MKILLVEDDKFFQLFYANKLREKNLEVEVATDGEDGLAKMRQVKPDMVLLDIIMPKKDGFEVLKEVAKDESLKTIPIIVFSTLGQEEDVKKALSLGARDYISKTFFDFEKLYQKIYFYLP